MREIRNLFFLRMLVYLKEIIEDFSDVFREDGDEVLLFDIL